jgi:hypothetical protein
MPDETSGRTGGCGCGAVRFTLDAPPVGAAYCHCTRCQRRSGTAASPSVRVAPGSFRLLQGEDLLRAWSPPGGGFDKLFCAACGSAISANDPATGLVAAVRFGAFDEDPGVRPQWRQYVADAAAWEPIPDDGLPRHPGRAPG